MYKLKLRFSYVLFPFALMQKEKVPKEKIKTAFSRYSTSQFSGTKRTRYAQTAFCPYPKIAAFRFTLRK
ncbi:hypothetical protein ACIXFU_15450 [Bacteroides fragilis]